MMNTLRHIVVGWLIRLILQMVPKDDDGLALVASLGQWAARSIEQAPQDIREWLYSGDKAVRVWISTDGETWKMIGRATDRRSADEIVRSRPASMPKVHVKLCRLDQRLSDVPSEVVGTLYSTDCRHPLTDAPCGYDYKAAHVTTVAEGPLSFAGIDDKTVETCRKMFGPGSKIFSFEYIPTPEADV